jgi:hypothetical protein
LDGFIIFTIDAADICGWAHNFCGRLPVLMDWPIVFQIEAAAEFGWAP